jgi:hypothetical protein
MARIAHDREDLLRDARALIPRVKFRMQAANADATVVAGFRGEALSLYINDDPAFHFNGSGQLRRVFLAGRLIKAEAGRLIAMTRVRTDKQIELHAEELAETEQQLLLSALANRLVEIKAALESGDATIDGQVPADGDAVPRLIAWLIRNDRPTPAPSPRIG